MNEELRKKFDEMKAKYQDALLLFNVGDFYETYEEDAETVAEVLGLTLTRKGDTKMAGFPRHSLGTYLPKLVRAGKRVVICEQMLETKVVKKLVKRGETSTQDVESSIQDVESSTDTSQTFNSKEKMEVKKIPLAHIEPSPMNPRKTFNEGDLQELAANIKVHGLLQPITVRPMGPNDNDPMGHFEIVCGERRFRAMKMIEAPDVACIVREMSDEEALDAMITENLQRQDVDPIEEAFAFGQLHSHGKSIEDIALRFGKSQRFISERIKLDKLLPELKAWVSKGWMNIGAALHISKLSEEDQKKFHDEFLDKYDEDSLDETNPINKSDALEFTQDLFMEIDRAEWSKDFEGSCETTCEKCQFNNANVGCLFYEMKPHDANCTNRERWNTKRNSWLLHMVEENADVLVKYGDDLETGKTVVVAEPSSYYQDRNPEYEPLIERIKEMGFDVVSKEDYFERYSFYREDDERLQEKLANNEVYRCLVVEAGWRGTEIHIRYYEFKRKGTEESKDEVKAMQLVNTYKENIRRSTENKANKLRELLNKMDPDELPKCNLSPNEGYIFFALLLRRCSHKFREKCGVVGYDQKKSLLDFVIENGELGHRIRRDFMREVLGGSDVTWSTDLQQCQSLLLHEWEKDKVEEIEAEYDLKLAKKQAKIVEQLTELGYTVDGKKIEQ